MPKTCAPLLCFLTVLLCGTLSPAAAHNGAVALAVPLQGITIDGDLADWPAAMTSYLVTFQERGAHPKPDDFEATFRLGYNQAENALYLALEVADDRASETAADKAKRNTHYNSHIYFDLNHKKANLPTQYYYLMNKTPLPSDGAIDAAVRAATQWEEKMRHYEWRIDITRLSDEKITLQPGTSLGFDLFLWDNHGGARSWWYWGPGRGKPIKSANLGDVLCIDQTAALGRLAGQVLRLDQRTTLEHSPVQLRPQPSKTAWIQVLADSLGNFALELPAGQYALTAGWGSADQSAQTVAIETDQETTLIAVATPPTGTTLKAGPGRRVEAGTGIQQGPWLNLDIQDGLSFISSRLIIDRKGFMWFGGWDLNLSRFDGREFLTFTTASFSIDHTIKDVLEDREGHIWLAHNHLSRYAGGTFTHFTSADGLPPYPVHCLLEDRQGRLWIGTSGGGVSLFDGTYFKTFQWPKPSANFVLTALEDQAGHIWLGTSDGLGRYAGETFTRFTAADGLPHNTIWAIFQDVDGSMWIGTGNGLAHFDGKHFTSFDTTDGLGHNQINSIYKDTAGQMWIGTNGGGVSTYAPEETSNAKLETDAKRFTTYTTQYGLGHNQVFAAVEDPAGGLWFSTTDGLSRYTRTQFTTYTEADGLAHYGVRTVMEDRHGTLWIGDWKIGLTRFDGQHFTTFTSQDGLPPGYGVHDILEDRQGNLWFASQGGLSRYDGKRFNNYTTTDDGFLFNNITALLEDHAGHLWVGTSNGLRHYDGESFTHFTTADGLPHNTIAYGTALAEDGEGGLWIGTIGGLSRYDGKSFKNYTTDDGLAHNWVSAVTIDRDGQMWVGTRNGISLYKKTSKAKHETDGQAFTTFTTADGLPHNYVATLLADRQGHLWIGTNGGGVSRYDGLVFQNLSSRDGLAGNFINDLYQDRQGAIWIAAEGGLTRYQPRLSPSSVAITGVVADRPYRPEDPIRLPTSQRLLTIKFEGRSFSTHASHMAYVYRLEGYDDTWQATYNEQVVYEDLPRGQYTFQVRAVDRDLTYSEKTASLSVTMHWPYERLGWGGALALALALTGWQTYRVVQRGKTLRSSNSALNQANAELRHEMAERSRLDQQLQHLRYLDQLRDGLGRARTPSEAFQQAGTILSQVLNGVTGQVYIEYDEHRWHFGPDEKTNPCHYRRHLSWDDQDRGQLQIHCAVELSEAQERVLLTETAQQLSRWLQAQELTAQLLQSGRLVALGQMAAGVTHELNQPLSAISTVIGGVHLQLLEDTAPPPDSIKAQMQQVLRLVGRMADTLKQLRLFGRERVDEPSAPFALNQAVDSSLLLIQAQLKAHHIILDTHLAHDLPMVEGHPQQVEQIVLNLLANARDALDEKTLVVPSEEKRLHLRTLYRAEPSPGVVLEVEDNGIGMEKEVAARVFEPFFTTKAVDRGTGLGLSISYAIAKNHQGTLLCDSRKGVGTTFRLWLPVQGGPKRR